MKVNGKQLRGDYFAYDNCHKIYILENDKEINEAKSYGYEIYHIDDLEKIYNESCSLRFIYPWNLEDDDIYSCQFEECVFSK